MYIFLDTEFTDFKDCELISLGLISEDGWHEFYVEISDYNYMLSSGFVKETVLPLLEGGKYTMTFAEARRALIAWIDGLPADPTIVVDYPTDWWLFCNLTQEKTVRKVNVGMIENTFLHMLHERGVHLPYELHLAFVAMHTGFEDYYEFIDKRRHHALVDAKANRWGWEKGYKKLTQVG